MNPIRLQVPKKATKKINSKQKGKTGELELSHFLTEAGFPARRGQQFKGTAESPDVVSEGLSYFHIECKRTERGNLYDWLRQAEGDAGSNIPLVCHRRNNEEWVAILKLEDFLKVIK